MQVSGSCAVVVNMVIDSCIRCLYDRVKDCRHGRNYQRDGGGGANLLGQVNVISLGKCFSACNFCSDLT